MKTKQIGVIAVVLVTVVLIFSSFVIVDSGRVGVVRTLGAVQPEALKEAFTLRNHLSTASNKLMCACAKPKTKPAPLQKTSRSFVLALPSNTLLPLT